MDNISRYKYAYGGMNDLLKGRFEKLKTANSLDKLTLINYRSSILVPQFIGVYQESELKPDTLEERENIGAASMGKKMAENVVDRVAQARLSQKGKADRSTPNLIHIGYNSEIYNGRLARELFGEGLERVKFSSYDRLPNFSAKDRVEILEYVKKMAEKIEIEDEEGVEKLSREAYNFIDEQLRIFGLTRTEYAFLDVLYNAANPLPNETKFIIPPNDEIEEILQNLLKLEKK